jgi:alkylhydroperoxidase family enzyme
MTDIRLARETVVAEILEGDGKASPAQRRAAFQNSGLQPLNWLIDKVANHAYKVTDQDFDGVRNSGLSEDEIFEIVVCAAVGEATRQHDRALVALEAATQKGKGSQHAPCDSQ